MLKLYGGYGGNGGEGLVVGIVVIELLVGTGTAVTFIETGTDEEFMYGGDAIELGYDTGVDKLVKVRG